MTHHTRPTRRPPAHRRPASRRPSVAGRIITGLFIIAFFGGSLALAMIFVQNAGAFANGFVQTTGIPLPQVPGMPESISGPVWNGTERVNILLLGMDCREDDTQGTCRSDSMMVASLDPKTEQIGLLSLPRDLWVPIPVSSSRTVEDRINTTFVYAQVYHYSGGGVALAKQTVQYNLGVNIHYAAWVDFDGFVKVVDTLGGLDIDVERPLKDNEYPTEDYRTKNIYFAPGLQHMDGKTALIYARSRHQDSDINRASRQQQVLIAARERALQLDLLPKLPELIQKFRSTVGTDLTPAQIIALARVAKDVDPKSVVVRTAPGTPIKTSTGADVLQLDRRALAKVVNDVFSSTSGDAEDDTASIEVLNATTTVGLATRTAGLLTGKGLQVVRFDTADEGGRTETVIYAAAGKRKTAEKIAGILGLPPSRVQDRPKDLTTTADVRVLLGKDVKVPVN